MPDLEYFLVCESVSVDRETNRVSFFNVLEDFTVAEPGSAPGGFITQFAAVSCWNQGTDDGDSEHEVTVRIRAPEVDNHESKIRFQMNKKRQRLIMRFLGGLPPLPDGGAVVFELLLNDQYIAKHTINIEKPVSR